MLYTLAESKDSLLARARADWRVLDEELSDAAAVRLISHERFSDNDVAEVECIAPWKICEFVRKIEPLYALLHSLRLLLSTKKNCVLIINGSAPQWLFVGLLNRFAFAGAKRVLCWDVFIETDNQLKRKVFAAAFKGFTLGVLWSRKQIKPHAEFLDLDEDPFIYLPYKANHSKNRRYDVQEGNYLFAGGNGKRDYNTLVNAVEGTGIPVIISATDPKVQQGIRKVDNVIVLAAREPAFAQLQAAARLIVVPMINSGLKGGGEANFCNAMWHGKAIIAADSMAAYEYIEEGKTGYIVESGDTVTLKQRIVELWEDAERARAMGDNGRKRAEEYFTHRRFINRLLRLATSLAPRGDN